MDQRHRGIQTSLDVKPSMVDRSTQTDVQAQPSYYREDNNVITYWKLKSQILSSKEKTIQFCQQKGVIKFDFFCSSCNGKMIMKKRGIVIVHILHIRTYFKRYCKGVAKIYVEPPPLFSVFSGSKKVFSTPNSRQK